MSHGSSETSGELARELGVFGASVSGIGVVLGAGIYVLVGEAAADAGSAVWASFFLASLLAAATGLSYAELTSMFPEAGASAAFAEEAFGARPAFIVGWLDNAVNVIGAAAVAIGFGGYAAELLGWDAGTVSFGLILLAGFVAWFGVREMIGMAVIFALLEGAGLLLVIVVGLPDIGSRSLVESPQGALGVLAGASLVFFAYEGFEEIASLAEETRDPTRTLPIAILAAVVVTTVIYLAVSATAVSVLPWEALSASDAPLADVVRVAWNERMADALSVVALFATGNTVLLLVASSARITYGMAGRRLLPHGLSRVGRRRTPWVATAVITAVAAAFTLVGDIGFVAQVTNFAVFGLFLTVNLAVIRLRRQRPALARPFRIPGAVGGVPITAAIGVAGTLLLAVTMDGDAFIAGLAALAVGTVLAFATVRGEDAGTAPR